MKDYATFEISEIVFEKFKQVILQNGELEDEVIEKMMLEYIRKNISKSENKKKQFQNHEGYVSGYAKAKRKIPLWAMKSNQMNHRIIRAYFQLADEYSQITLENLSRRCSNAELFPDTYCRNFKTNFDQMKTDAGNFNGKVFIVERGYVSLWGVIETVLLEYKGYFVA